MKLLLLLLVLSIPGLTKSQDTLIFRNGDKLTCKITKIDNLNIYYTFSKNERTINSFAEKNEIRSYQIYNKSDSTSNLPDSRKLERNKPVIVDTSVYVKSESKWINLITFSPKYGIHATGWSAQYYGYLLKSNAGWIIPCVFSFESFNIDPDYFDQSGYQAGKLNYWMAGICPFKKLNDYFYANLGLQLLMGNEQLVDFNNYESTNFVFGIVPTQGIYFIPQSSFGITFGLGLYEKLLTSEIYKNDVGIKFEIGIKF